MSSLLLHVVHYLKCFSTVCLWQKSSEGETCHSKKPAVSFSSLALFHHAVLHFPNGVFCMERRKRGFCVWKCQKHWIFFFFKPPTQIYQFIIPALNEHNFMMFPYYYICHRTLIFSTERHEECGELLIRDFFFHSSFLHAWWLCSVRFSCLRPYALSAFHCDRLDAVIRVTNPLS